MVAPAAFVNTPPSATETLPLMVELFNRVEVSFNVTVPVTVPLFVNAPFPLTIELPEISPPL